MSSRQAVVLASRVLCVYFLFNAVVNLLNFPGELFVLHHNLRDSYGSAILGYRNFLIRYDSLDTEVAVLRLAGELFLAGVFYRCGKRVSTFLMGDADAGEVSD